MRKSRLEWAMHKRFIEHFVSGSTARTAVSLVGVNKEYGGVVLSSPAPDHRPGE